MWRGGAHAARAPGPGPAIMPTISVHVTPRPCDSPGRLWLQNGEDSAALTEWAAEAQWLEIADSLIGA